MKSTTGSASAARLFAMRGVLLDVAQTARYEPTTMPYLRHRGFNMGRDRMAGICVQFKGRLKECWGAFSVNPLLTDEGRRDRIAGLIQEQRAFAKENTERALKDFLTRNRNWRNLSRE